MYQFNMDEAVDKYADMVYRLALIKTNQEADAKDVFGEVFLKLVHYKDKIESEEHLKAWLLKVTINCAIKQETSLWKRRVSYLEDRLLQEADYEEGYRAVETGPVVEAVRELDEKYREVIHLHYFEDCSIEKISKLLGKKEGTVKSLLSRGRRLLKKKLTKERSL